MSPVSGARAFSFPSSGFIVFSSAAENLKPVSSLQRQGLSLPLQSSRGEFFERRELVLLAPRLAVELLRGLVKLEATVGCRCGAEVSKRLHLVFGVRLEAARDA